MSSTLNLVETRRALHRIPEAGFQEFATQAYVLQCLAALPQSHLSVTTWRTGVLVEIKGSAPERRVAYRCDMDGLPVAEETGAAFASTHEGMMHACGHDVHMTIALGLVDHFAHHRPTDDLLVIFQPAEEGPGGALPMLESEPFQAHLPDAIFALHVEPALPVGHIGIRPGVLFANTSELFIDLIGTSGHAAFPHRSNDMIVAGAHLITALQSIVSRNVNPLESAVITIGKLESGTKQNIISGHSRLEGTIRTLTPALMPIVKRRIEDMLNGIASMFDCETRVDYGANYYQVWNDERLTESFIAFANDLPVVTVEEVPAAMTGEDFGYFLRDIPGFLFWLGAETPYGLHHPSMLPDERCIQTALDVLIPYFTERGYRNAID